MSYPPQGLDKADVLGNQATLLTRLSATRATNLDEIPFIEHHVHNLDRWFGKSADQSGNNWATEGSLTPFQVISGDGAFGTAVKVIGSEDTPVIAGRTKYDLHRLHVIATAQATVYIVRFIFGSGTDADVEEAAGRYTDTPYIREAANGRGAPIEIRMPDIPVGKKHWVKVKNATNGATLDFIVGLHEYPYSEP